MITEQQFLEALEIVKAYKMQIEELIGDSVQPTKNEILEKKVIDLGMSFRSCNLICSHFHRHYSHKGNGYDDITVGDILRIDPKDISRIRGLGVKSQKEIVDTFFKLGFNLMK